MRRAAFVLALLALPLFACGGGDDAAKQDTDGFDATRAMADVEHLATQIGPRPAGSPQAAEAAEYIASRLAEARFGVFKTRFSFEVDPNRPAEVTLGSKVLPAVTAAGSKAGTATGLIADVGTGGPVPAGSLAGKVAVARRGGTSFHDKYRFAAEGGAAALVIVNTAEGELIAELDAAATIPVVTLASTEGEALLAAVGQQLRVSVPEPEVAGATNVIGRAVTAHDCVYIVMANFDSAPGAAGANDNASGVAVMLELARQFGARDDIPAVCFIAVDGGVVGARGAFLYAQTHTASPPAGVIFLRGVGASAQLAVFGDSLLQQDALEIAEGLGIKVQTGGAATSAGTGSQSFRENGVATLDIVRSTSSQAEPVVPARLRETGLLVGELMTRLSVINQP